MLRVLPIAAMFALAVPTLAMAQTPPPKHYTKPASPGGPHPAFVHPGPGPGGPHPHAFVHPGPGPGPGPGGPHPAFAHPGPGPGGPGARFGYHGHFFNPVHGSPWAYPPGWGYRLWAVGAILPPLFLAPAYYYTDWATLGLDAPPPGDQWVRYGPDLLLVDVSTGQVVEVIPGVFD